MNFLVTTLSLLYSIFCFAENKNVDLKFKARSLQARERIEELKNKLKKGQTVNKDLSKIELCEFKFELFFYSFADPESSKDIKIKILDGKATAYFFLYFTNKELTFQMNYQYFGNDEFPGITEILTIKDPNTIKLANPHFSSPYPNKINLITEDCHFIFDQNDPFAGTFDALK